MNNINKPLVHKIKQPATFSGKILLGFLQSVLKKSLETIYHQPIHLALLSLILPQMNRENRFGQMPWLSMF